MSEGETHSFEPQESVSTFFTHDDSENPFAVTQRFENNGGQTHFTYKPNGDLQSMEDALGNVTSYLYAEDVDSAPLNPKHRHLLRKIQRAQVTLKEGAPDESTVIYQPTELQYDANGNLNKIIDALGQETTFVYSADGMVESITDKRGHTTEFVYEGAAFDGSYRRLLQIKIPKGLQPSDGFRTLTFGYDDADNPDNVTSITNDLGHVVHTEYDVKDRVTQVTDGRGNVSSFSFLDGLLEELEVPGNNGSAGLTRTSAMVYDSSARLTEVHRDVSPGNQQLRVKYSFNGFSELEQLVRLKDTVEKSFTITRDALGRGLSSTDPLQNTNLTLWESSCQGRTETSARSIRMRHGVDLLCRTTMLEAGEPEPFDDEGIETVRETRTYFYDELGRMVKTSQKGLPFNYAESVLGIDPYGDLAKERLYEYDELNRMTKVRFRTDEDPAGARDQIMVYEFDEEGNVTRFTDTEGKVTRYEYFRDNLLHKVTIKRPSQSDRVFTYSYDPAGRLDKIVYPTSTDIEAVFRDETDLAPTGIGTGFDANGNLRFLRYQKTDGTLIRRYEWTYDDSNNRQSQLEVTPTKAILWEYSVDWLDRLVAVKRAEAVDVASLPASPLGAVHLQREYVWDESDNRTFFDDHVAGVTYHYTYKSIDDNGTTRWSDQLEEILIYATAAGHRTVGDFVSFETLTTDEDGNLTKRTIAATGEEISYEFSEFDRLKRVESDLGGNVTRLQDARYGVDGLRNRKLDKDGNSSEEYGPGIMTSASAPGSGSSNAPSISYVAGHLLLGAEVDGSFVFHLPDALGTTRDVIDDQGNVIRSFEFSEYGDLISSSGSGTISPKTWIGGLSVNDDTADSGMFNMGHRNFSSLTGRFISRDPIGHAGGLNLYAYGANNPVTMLDHTGLKPIWFKSSAVSGERQIWVAGYCDCPEAAESSRPITASVSTSKSALDVRPKPNQAFIKFDGPEGFARGLVDPTTGHKVIIDPSNPNWENYPPFYTPAYSFSAILTVHGCECLDGCGEVISEGTVISVRALPGGGTNPPFSDHDILFS